MQKLLSKFFIIKSVIYLIWFSILGYLTFVKLDMNTSTGDDISYSTGTNQVCMSDHCFDVEIADTDVLRQQWLMYRETLPSQSGMLFVFDKEQKYPFWMKNTLIPLDIIWIDRDNRIVDIQTATPCKTEPCPTYDPKADSLYVLEINAGIAQLLWIQSWAITQFKKK